MPWQKNEPLNLPAALATVLALLLLLQAMNSGFVLLLQRVMQLTSS